MFVLVLPYLGEYIFSLFAINNVTANSIKRNEKKIEKLKQTGGSEELIKELEASIEEDKVFLGNYKPREDTKITITRNDNAKYLILVLLIILIGGIFTPTGTMPFTYFIKTSHGNAMSYINEHMPLVVASSIEFVAATIIVITLIAFTDSKMRLSDAFLVVGLYFMTFISRRHLTLLILLTSVTLIKMADSFIKKHMNTELYDEKYLKSARKFYF